MRFVKLLFLGLIFNISALQAQDIVDEYIGAFQYIAVSEMERTGIPASIKLAQGLLESSWGRSELSTEAHNHFGIKCGSKWMGNTFMKEDDDYDKSGKLKKSCFRVFESDQASYIAHSEFLLSNQRYGFLFDYSETDHKAWAKGLRKAGYASDPSYPSKLIGIIKKYDLARFDYMVADEMHLLAEGGSEKELSAEEEFMKEAMEAEEEAPLYAETRSEDSENTSEETSFDDVLDEFQKSAKNLWNKRKEKRKNNGKSNFDFDKLLAEVKSIGDDIIGKDRSERITSTPNTETYNDVKIVIANAGESLEMIAALNNVAVEKLVTYNENLYTPSQILHRGVSVYLEPKKTIYEGSANTHYVQMRQSIAEISQQYGITAESIRKRNYLKADEEVKHSEILYLRGVRISAKPIVRKSSKSKNSRTLFEADSSVDE